MKYIDHPQFKEHRRWLFDQVLNHRLLVERHPEGDNLHGTFEAGYDAMVHSLAMFADRDPELIRGAKDRDELWRLIADGPSWKAKINRQVARDLARRGDADG